jgi:CMP-N,N'-diacetyllegionaminic acid synthase
LIVHLRPTTPLREASLVAAAVEALRLDAEATALRSVHEMSESAYKCFEIKEQRLKTVGSGSFELDAANEARQLFPKTYQANGYVDVLKTEFIRAQQRIHGSRVTDFITPPVTEVDTEAEFALLEYQAGSNPAIISQLFA